MVFKFSLALDMELYLLMPKVIYWEWMSQFSAGGRQEILETSRIYILTLEAKEQAAFSWK